MADLEPGLQVPAGIHDQAAYWSGFAHGVQRVVRDTAED